MANSVKNLVVMLYNKLGKPKSFNFPKEATIAKRLLTKYSEEELLYVSSNFWGTLTSFALLEYEKCKFIKDILGKRKKKENEIERLENIKKDTSEIERPKFQPGNDLGEIFRPIKKSLLERLSLLEKEDFPEK